MRPWSDRSVVVVTVGQSSPSSSRSPWSSGNADHAVADLGYTRPGDRHCQSRHLIQARSDATTEQSVRIVGHEGDSVFTWGDRIDHDAAILRNGAVGVVIHPDHESEVPAAAK